MRVGLISDVHANVVALRAVLEDAPAIDDWLHAGDVVGYGPWPAETIDLFETRGIASVQGNHDRGVLGDFHEGFVGLPRESDEWTTERLNDDELAYLDGLPVETDEYDRTIHLAHGAPDAPNTYTYPEDMERTLLGGERLLVLGHTHVQARREFEAGTIVNPGGTGQPRDGDPRAPYAVYDTETDEVELRRVDYPHETVQEKLVEYDFPDRLVDAYATGEIVPADRAERPEN